MSTALYFSNNVIKGIRGSVKGGKLKADTFFTVEIPSGIVENGVVNEPVRLGGELSKLLREKQIDSKVWITIDSTNILVKTSIVPFLRPAELITAARQEFDSMESGQEDLICDYSVLEERSGAEKNGRVLCCAMSRSMLQGYADALKEARLIMEGCDIALNSLIKAVSLFPSLQKETYILSTVEKGSISCQLFSEGRYLFSNRALLFSQPDTDEYAAEMAGKLSAIKQFYKPEPGAAPLERVYLYGLEEKEVERCSTMVSYLGLKVEALPASPFVKTQGGVPFSLGDYLAAAGCLIRK